MTTEQPCCFRQLLTQNNNCIFFQCIAEEMKNNDNFLQLYYLQSLGIERVQIFLDQVFIFFVANSQDQFYNTFYSNFTDSNCNWAVYWDLWGNHTTYSKPQTLCRAQQMCNFPCQNSPNLNYVYLGPFYDCSSGCSLPISTCCTENSSPLCAFPNSGDCSPYCRGNPSLDNQVIFHKIEEKNAKFIDCLC